MWISITIAGAGLIILVIIISMCGFFKKPKQEPPKNSTQYAFDNPAQEADIEVIYNPGSGALELGSKSAKPESINMNTISTTDARHGIVNKNFIEDNLTRVVVEKSPTDQNVQPNIAQISQGVEDDRMRQEGRHVPGGNDHDGIPVSHNIESDSRHAYCNPAFA